MKARTFACLAALLLGCGAAPDAAPPTVDPPPTPSSPVETARPPAVTASPIANLAFQLDCLSRPYPLGCTQDAYKTLWASLGSDPLDESMLKKLRAIGSKYERELTPVPKLRYPLAEHAHYQSALIRAAWFDATSTDDGEQRLTQWMTAADAKSMADVLRHFEPRFQTWWQSTAGAECERYAHDLEEQLKDPWVAETVQRVAHFTRTEDLLSVTFNMHAILKPGNSGSTSATQVESHLPFEFEAGEAARERVDVLLHEMTHYYFANIPNDALARLATSVETRFGTDAAAAFGLLNEGIATAVGNGIAGQHFMPERFPECFSNLRCLYNDDAIHTTAASLAESPSWFNATIDSTEFMDAYAPAIAKARQTEGAHLLPLRATFAVYTTSQFVTPLALFRNRARMGSISAYGSESVELRSSLVDYPIASFVAFARPGDLSSIDLLPGAARKTNATCQMRVDDRAVWVLVANDESTMQAEVEKAASVPPPTCGEGQR